MSALTRDMRDKSSTAGGVKRAATILDTARTEAGPDGLSIYDANKNPGSSRLCVFVRLRFPTYV